MLAMPARFCHKPAQSVGCDVSFSGGV